MENWSDGLQWAFLGAVMTIGAIVCLTVGWWFYEWAASRYHRYKARKEKLHW